MTEKASLWSLIKSASSDSILSSTIHGFPNIFKTERVILKALWIILSIFSLVFCLLTVYQNVSNYSNYNVISETKTVSKQPFIFPAITLCTDFPFNLLEMTKFCAFNYEYSNCYDQQNVSIFESFQEQDYFGRYNCIRFNGFRNGSTELKSSIGTSFMSGFQIEFLIPYASLGLHVYVADNDVNYFERLMPFYASATTEVQLYFRKMVEKLMPYPYNECFMTKISEHTQENCVQKCIHQNVANIYNCSFPGFYMVKTKHLCDKDYFTQYRYFEFLKLRSSFEPECKENCLKECETTRYETTLLQQPLKMNHPERNRTARVIAFFAELTYRETMQVPQITLSCLISSIGGTLGVFLGLSLLSFAEIIQYLIRIFCILCDNFSNKSK